VIFVVEFIKGIVGEDARFGIATVQPDRSVKKCRIRNLRIEYFIAPNTVMPIIPKSCEDCESFVECVEDFAWQIVKKYYSCHNSDTYWEM
jgi:hypothetical protein